MKYNLIAVSEQEEPVKYVFYLDDEGPEFTTDLEEAKIYDSFDQADKTSSGV